MFNLKLTSIGDVLHLSIHGRRAVVKAIPDERWNLDGDQEIGRVLKKMFKILTWVCSPETWHIFWDLLCSITFAQN